MRRRKLFWDILPSYLLLTVVAITAVAIAASTRLGQVMTLLICAGVFLVGLISEYVLGQ